QRHPGRAAAEPSRPRRQPGRHRRRAARAAGAGRAAGRALVAGDATRPRPGRPRAAADAPAMTLSKEPPRMHARSAPSRRLLLVAPLAAALALCAGVAKAGTVEVKLKLPVRAALDLTGRKKLVVAPFIVVS